MSPLFTSQIQTYVCVCICMFAPHSNEGVAIATTLCFVTAVARIWWRRAKYAVNSKSVYVVESRSSNTRVYSQSRQVGRTFPLRFCARLSHPLWIRVVELFPTLRQTTVQQGASRWPRCLSIASHVSVNLRRLGSYRRRSRFALGLTYLTRVTDRMRWR